MNNTENDISEASKTIKHMQDEILENIRERLAVLKRKFGESRESYFLQERNNTEAIVKGRRKLEDLRSINKLLTTKKSKLEEEIRKDELEKQKAAEKFQQMEAELNILSEINTAKQKLRSDLFESIQTLNAKYLIQKNKFDTSDKHQMEINSRFRKFLGLEIECIKENKLKIGFNNLGVDCYFIIDFNSKDCVTECVPEINIERANFLFKEIQDFYKFIKTMRNEIKSKLT